MLWEAVNVSSKLLAKNLLRSHPLRQRRPRRTARLRTVLFLRLLLARTVHPRRLHLHTVYRRPLRLRPLGRTARQRPQVHTARLRPVARMAHLLLHHPVHMVHLPRPLVLTVPRLPPRVLTAPRPQLQARTVLLSRLDLRRRDCTVATRSTAARRRWCRLLVPSVTSHHHRTCLSSATRVVGTTRLLRFPSAVRPDQPRASPTQRSQHPSLADRPRA